MYTAVSVYGAWYMILVSVKHGVLLALYLQYTWPFALSLVKRDTFVAYSYLSGIPVPDTWYTCIACHGITLARIPEYLDLIFHAFIHTWYTL